MRRLFLIVSCWLLAGLAWGGMPSPRDYLPQDSGSATAAPALDWLSAAVYFGPIAAAAFVPRRYWFVMPLAFCWPFFFWLGAWMLRS